MKVSCALYVEVTEPEDLSLLDLEALPGPLMVIGGGSNLLFSGDFPGTVLHVGITGSPVILSVSPVILSDSEESLRVRVGAGVVFDDFCAWAAKENLWGPENLSLIPGEVGASAVQNIGAYGVEAKDLIDTVHAYDLRERRFVDIPAADCAYGYRDSRFKGDWKGRFIITAVTYRLSRTPQPRLDYGGVRKALEDRGIGIDSGTLRTSSSVPPIGSADGPLPLMCRGRRQVPEPAPIPLTPKRIREAIIGIRQKKLPDPAVLGSAGSFFKNPVVSREHFARIVAVAQADNGPGYEVPHYDVGVDQVKVPAAWMIEQCGFKGMRLGGAQVYPGQPLVIVNATGSATPGEVMALEQRIIATIAARYGVTLHPEVEHIPAGSAEIEPAIHYMKQ